jgi:hypothetical protein
MRTFNICLFLLSVTIFAVTANTNITNSKVFYFLQKKLRENKDHHLALQEAQENGGSA